MALAYTVVLLLGIVDYITGPDISFSIFYLAAILPVVWFIGIRAGVLISVVSALVWLTALLLWNVQYQHTFIPYWNATVRMGFFFDCGLFCSEIQIDQF